MIFIDNDFKTIQFAFYFTEMDQKDTRVYRFLLPKLMTSHTKEYPDKKRMSEKLEELYGIYFKTRVERVGNLSVISIVLTIPDPKVIQDRALLNESLNLLSSVLSKRASFNQEIFDSEKRMLIEQWLTLKDKKRLYAQTKFFEYFFDKDPYGEPLSGYLKDIKKLEMDSLLTYQNQLLDQERIDIVVHGHLSQEDQALITSQLSHFERFKEVKFDATFRAPRPLKTIIESTDMKQAILKLGYHMPVFRHDPLYDAAVIADIIIGGYPESRLFKIVREQEGLCYDIASNYEYYKGVLMISSGVDLLQKESALEKIKVILEDLKAHGIHEDELKNAKSFYAHQVKTSLDQQSIITKRAFIRSLLNYQETIEEKLLMIDSVEIKDVNLVLSMLHLDTIYVLHGGQS
jgi:predicted Zn-dependent peptidase